MKTLLCFAFLTGFASSSFAQFTLTTTGCLDTMNGSMFDVLALDDIQICRLEVCLPKGFFDVEVYTRNGSYLGFETNPSSWLFQGRAERVRNDSLGLKILPISLDVPVDVNDRLGIYIRIAGSISAPPLMQGRPATQGMVVASNADLLVQSGTRLTGLFSGPQAGWICSHAIDYLPRPTTMSCREFHPWQRNRKEARMYIDNRGDPNESDGFTPAVTNVPPSSQENLWFETSTGAGMPFDILLNGSPVVPAFAPGSFLTGAGQVINLDLSDPNTFSIFGGAPGNFQTVPTSPFGASVLLFPFMTGGLGTVSGLTAVIDPSTPDGFTVSEALQLDIVQDGTLAPAVPVPTGGTPQTLGDDDFTLVDLGFGFRYFGQVYTQAFVGSNGHLTFENGQATFVQGGAVEFSPPIIAPLSCDLDPSVAGVVRFWTDNSNRFDCVWEGVPTFGQTNTNTLSVTVDQGSSTVTFNYPNVTATRGTAALSSGNLLTLSKRVNLSLAGPGVPRDVNPGASPFEEFAPSGLFVGPFDLAGKQITQELDANGYPIRYR